MHEAVMLLGSFAASCSTDSSIVGLKHRFGLTTCITGMFLCFLCYSAYVKERIYASRVASGVSCAAIVSYLLQVHQQPWQKIGHAHICIGW
jgi:hypothetical protein